MALHLTLSAIEIEAVRMSRMSPGYEIGLCCAVDNATTSKARIGFLRLHMTNCWYI